MSDMTQGPAIRAVLIDDERPGRDNLRLALGDFPRWQVVGECANAAEARALLARERVEVAFIDVQMPGETGLELARSLCDSGALPLLVFVTAYSRYAVDAFEVHALDYLLKPLDDRRLAQALARAEARLAEPALAGYADAVLACVDEADDAAAGRQSPYLQRLMVRSIGKVEAVDVADVLAMTSAGNYVELQLPQRRLLHRVPLGRLEARLDPAAFMRTHRTAIVRRNQVRALEVVSDGAYRALLRDGGEVPVSARYVGDVRAVMALAAGAAE